MGRYYFSLKTAVGNLFQDNAIGADITTGICSLTILNPKGSRGYADGVATCIGCTVEELSEKYNEGYDAGILECTGGLYTQDEVNPDGRTNINLGGQEPRRQDRP